METEAALARAHAVDASGALRTGMGAFVAVWARLPYWWPLARVLRLPLAMEVAEFAYAAWAAARPLGARVAGKPPAAARAPGASCRWEPGKPPKDCV